MKARRLGTDNPFVDIDKVQLQGSDILFSAEVMEFKEEPNYYYRPQNVNANQQFTEIDYWNKLKHQAAIAAMQGLLADSSRTGAEVGYAEFAVACAESLIEKLKGG